MYLDHYNLTEKPFEITADPRFLWLGEKHEEALAMLKYGVLSGKGFLLLTGDVGTGKTTLINALLKDLEDNVIAATLRDPSLERLEFYDFVASVFGVEGPFSSKPAFQRAFEKFLNEAYSNGKKVLLIIDEAQRLSRELLEEIRLLSNIEKEDSKLLNVFFVGQDEFKDMLAADECRALRQRIATTYQINPLTQIETAEYIRHRLKVAGTEEEVFTRGGIEEIFAFSQGYPRLINIVCDHALLTGYVKDLRRIDRAVILECSHELSIHTATKRAEVEVPAPQSIEDAAASRGVWRRFALYALLMLALGLCGYLVLSVGYASALKNVRQYYGELFARGEPVASTGKKASERHASSRRNVISDSPAPGRLVAERPVSPVDGPESEEIQRRLQPSQGERGIDTAESPDNQEHDRAVQSVSGEQHLQEAPGTGGAQTEVDRSETAAVASSDVPMTRDEGEEREASADQQELETIFTEGKLVVPFGYGRARIVGEAPDLLDRLAALMNKDSDIAVVVKGFTDALGAPSSNQKLGQLRATAVKEYLVGRGVSPLRIEALGMGEQNPRAPNTTRTGRAANRRVEIELQGAGVRGQGSGVRSRGSAK